MSDALSDISGEQSRNEALMEIRKKEEKLLFKYSDKLIDEIINLWESAKKFGKSRGYWSNFDVKAFAEERISLLKEITVKQIRESWRKGGYLSRHSTSELFTLLEPVRHIGQLKKIPTLLVYSRRDVIAPPEHGQAMRRVAPHAACIESKKASHVMLTLSLDTNREIARWFKTVL